MRNMRNRKNKEYEETKDKRSRQKERYGAAATLMNKPGARSASSEKYRGYYQSPKAGLVQQETVAFLKMH